MIRAYRHTFPKELFRLNNGTQIRLRPWTEARPQRYDIFIEEGLVLPKALDAKTYSAPNGASMRPNSPYQQSLVRRFEGNDVLIYAVLKGTKIPADLALVHERADHWSLQPAKVMELEELNRRLTDFFISSGLQLTPAQWKKLYPSPTSNVRQFGDFSAATLKKGP